MNMFSNIILSTALLVSLCAGCGETDKTSEPQPAVAQKEVPSHPAVAPPRAAPEPEKPAEPAVSKEQIDRAARFYAVLHASMSEDDRQKTVDGLMETNGWTEESYQALLYDIAQDPPSREAYLRLTHRR